jgi:hypothetical protein
MKFPCWIRMFDSWIPILSSPSDGLHPWLDDRSNWRWPITWSIWPCRSKAEELTWLFNMLIS